MAATAAAERGPKENANSPFGNASGKWKKVSVLLSASVERLCVSRMHDIFVMFSNKFKAVYFKLEKMLISYVSECPGGLVEWMTLTEPQIP